MGNRFCDDNDDYVGVTIAKKSTTVQEFTEDTAEQKAEDHQ